MNTPTYHLNFFPEKGCFLFRTVAFLSNTGEAAKTPLPLCLRLKPQRVLFFDGYY
jgi:hypothetical protein